MLPGFFEMLVLFFFVAVPAVMIGFVILLARLLNGPKSSAAGAQGESRRMQELHSQQERLVERLESLETVLLNEKKER